MRRGKKLTVEKKKYWLWVTRPKYYLDKDGNERQKLDPGSGEDLWGTWTCNKGTQKGDLVLLWRTKKSDIAYLFQAKSEAFENQEDLPSKGWSYYCEMVPIFKFHTPLTISEIKKNPYLQDWNALSCKFQHSNFEISPENWEKINQLLIERNQGYKKVLERIERRRIPIRLNKEEQLEDRLAKNPAILKSKGYNLDLVGRQMICIGGDGRIDLLFHDKKKKCFVVVELKNVEAGQNTFGQISSYIGWVKERLAGSQPVKGLVISRGKDSKFENAIKSNPNVSQLNIWDLGFK